MTDDLRVPRGTKVLLALGFLLHLALLWITRTRSIGWDGVAFLDRVDQRNFVDAAHPLYPWVLGVWVRAGAVFGLPPEDAGRALSIVAASVALVAFWIFLRRAGARPWEGLLGTLLLVTAPSWWEAAVTLEVYMPALAGLLCASLGAQRSETLAGRCLLVLGAAVAVGFHVAMVLTFPWLAVWVLAQGSSSRRRSVVVLGTLCLVVFLLLWVLLGPAELVRFFGYARAFASEGPFSEVLSRNLNRFGRFFSENARGMGAAALFGFLVLGRFRDRRGLVGLSLIVPPTMVFLALGTPMLGLFLPMFPACAWLATRAAHRLGRLGVAFLVLLLAWQVSDALPARWHAARAPDVLRERAHRFASVLPQRAFVISRHAARHLSRYEAVSVLPLNEVVHRARMKGARGSALLAVVRTGAEEAFRRGESVWITTHALAFLYELQVPAEELLGFLAQPETRLEAGPNAPELVLRRVAAR